MGCCDATRGLASRAGGYLAASLVVSLLTLLDPHVRAMVGLEAGMDKMGTHIKDAVVNVTAGALKAVGSGLGSRVGDAIQPLAEPARGLLEVI